MIEKIYISCIFVCFFLFFSNRICLLVLKLQEKLKRKTNNNPLDRFKSYIVFAGRGHQKTIEVMMVMKITGQSVKFIGSKYIVCSFSKPLIYGFGGNAHDQFINPLIRPLLIVLQVVRTSFEFHFRECMGSSFPLSPCSVQ